jgi:hypothetical protein
MNDGGQRSLALHPTIAVDADNAGPVVMLRGMLRFAYQKRLAARSRCAHRVDPKHAHPGDRH